MSPHDSENNFDSDPRSEKFRPTTQAVVATAIVVAATYAYFLIFAQFGFLKIVQALVGKEGALLRPILALMGGCGVASSVGVARIYTEARGRPLLLLGFGGSGLAAALSLWVVDPTWLLICAALTGAGAGISTVTLAAMLRRAVGGEKLGGCIGAGTGLAYGLCNLPFVFNAGAREQAAMGITACVAGAFATFGLAPQAPEWIVRDFDYQPRVMAGWIAVFFALVWLDSAAFFVIQHTPVLKSGTWGGESQLYLNASVHATAAGLAGLLLDRRWLTGVVLTGATALLAACVLLGAGPGFFATGTFLYTTGVSFYSTALVFYPANSGRVGVAALVYAVAGWVGSAFGIGFAKNWGAVPNGLLVFSGALLASACFVRIGLGRREKRAQRRSD